MRKEFIQKYKGGIEPKIFYSLDELNSKIIPTKVLNEEYKELKSFEYNKYIAEIVERNNDEIFLNYQGDNEFENKLQISNYGRVRFGENCGKYQKFDILKQIDIKPFMGYLYLEEWKQLKELKIELKDIDYVYQMVAKTWLEIPAVNGDCCFDIHHISNNGYDNRPENLIYLTKCEHSKINHRTRE